jgi:hypothetical protein
VAALRTTLAASLNEVLPVSLLVFGLASSLLWLCTSSAETMAVLGLAIVLSLPALLPAAPLGEALGVVSDATCGEAQQGWVDRVVHAVSAPVSWTIGYAFLAGVAASFAAPRLGPAGAWLWRTALSVELATLVLVVISVGRRPGAETYLATRAVVAELFPATDPQDLTGAFPRLTVGSFNVQRWCPGPSGACTIGVGTGSMWHLGCADRGSTVVIRSADDGLWILDTGDRRYGFRLDPARPEGVRPVYILRTDLLGVARPPAGWTVGVLLGLAFTVTAGRWRRRAAAAGGADEDARAAAVGPYGMAIAVITLAMVAPWFVALAGR